MKVGDSIRPNKDSYGIEAQRTVNYIGKKYAIIALTRTADGVDLEIPIPVEQLHSDYELVAELFEVGKRYESKRYANAAHYVCLYADERVAFFRNQTDGGYLSSSQGHRSDYQEVEVF